MDPANIDRGDWHNKLFQFSQENALTEVQRAKLVLANWLFEARVQTSADSLIAMPASHEDKSKHLLTEYVDFGCCLACAKLALDQYEFKEKMSVCAGTSL